MIKVYRTTDTIKAERFDGSEEMVERYGVLDTEGAGLFLPTLEGNLEFHVGDWVVTGVKDEHWAIANDVFKQTYAELPVIPQAVADVIMYARNHKHGPYWVLRKSPNQLVNSDIISKSDLREYSDFWRKHGSQDVFARAWLDGYQVEEDK